MTAQRPLHAPGRVEIDAERHEEVFSCRLPTATWNGWVQPVFDLDTAKRVTEWAMRNGQDEYHEFVWTTDREGREALIYVQKDGDLRWYDYVGSEAEGFSVGSGYWTWSAVSDEAPTEPDALDAWLRARSERSTIYSNTWNTALHAAYGCGASSEEAVAAAREATQHL